MAPNVLKPAIKEFKGKRVELILNEGVEKREE